MSYARNTNSLASVVYVDESGTALYPIDYWSESAEVFPMTEHPAIALADDGQLHDRLRMSSRPGHPEQLKTVRQLLDAVATGDWRSTHADFLEWHLSEGTARSMIEAEPFVELGRRSGLDMNLDRRAMLEVTLCYGLFSLALLDIAEMLRAKTLLPRCPDCGLFQQPQAARHRDRLCESCRLSRERARKAAWKRRQSRREFP
jgi:hypothetical protein